MAVRFRCWLYDHPILALALPGFFFLIAILILNYHHASPQAPPEPTQPSSGRNEVPPPESSEHKLIFSPEASRGQLVHQEKPVYPPLARQARIQGTVVLKALISKTGDIEGLHLVSGHPMLAPAAIVAVKQWKYKPYLLNGEPVEVETTINVNFRLADAE
jgi:protein TonB